ncbi:cornifelin-like [Clavelina lepadiformis]|uniref:cornifelin-like n=1 Tax=Clavelina lepadiformis TaxID=159417 RepID=UPI004041E5DC
MMNTTQVITSQPAVVSTTVVTQQPTAKSWSTGLCDCCEDMRSCCCISWFGHWHYACLAQRMGEHCCVGYSGFQGGCVPGGHLAMRSRFRATHGIQGSICNDSCQVCFCLPCAMCQLSREMDYYGYPQDTCC